MVLAPGSLVGVAFVIVLAFIMIRRIVRGNRAGKTGKSQAAIGNALMYIEPLLRPSREHIIEARHHEHKQHISDADPPDTHGRHCQ